MATTKRLRSQRRQPAAAADADAPWSEPQISGRFETAIGSSIVEQIVIGHTPADVLRELVQNEFDAHGHRMHVTFGPEHLNVTGSGKPVDKAGWERLSVILGTGVVIGSTADACRRARGPSEGKRYRLKKPGPSDAVPVRGPHLPPVIRENGSSRPEDGRDSH